MKRETHDLGDAIADLAALKDEHRDLIARIASDPGMEASTRQALLEHIYAEEDEHVAGLQGLVGSRPQPAGPSGRGLTVGSLRREPGGLDPHRLGTLRNG